MTISKSLHCFVVVMLLSTIYGDLHATDAVGGRDQNDMVSSGLVPKTLMAPNKIEVPILFSVTDRHTDIHEDAIRRGVTYLNNDYENTWFEFYIYDIRWYDTADNFLTSDSQMDEMLDLLSKDNHDILNVVIALRLEASDGSELFGRSSLPWGYAQEVYGGPNPPDGSGQFSEKQGILIEKRRGPADYIVEEPVFPHEVGHFFGLYHTFEGGVSSEGGTEGQNDLGDSVEDTSCQWDEARSCDYGENTCIDFGVDEPDPIGNFMTYVTIFNDCRTWFSPGQRERMALKFMQHRYEMFPDVTDLSDSSWFYHFQPPVEDGYAVAHKLITNSGPAIVDSDKSVTLLVKAHSNGRIVLNKGFKALKGSKVVTEIENNVPGECINDQVKQYDCLLDPLPPYNIKEYTCIDGHWVLTLDEC